MSKLKRKSESKSHVFQGVYDLINTLSKEEKRHFSQFVSKKFQYKHQDYFKLYKSLLNCKNGSFEAFENIVETLGINNIYNAKNILEKEILQSLSLLHETDKQDFAVFQFYRNAEMLYEKGLLTQAGYFIEKAESALTKSENFWLIDRISFIRNRISYQIKYEYDDKALHEDEILFDHAKTNQKLKNIFAKCYHLRSKNTQPRNEEILNKIRLLANEIDEKSDLKTKSNNILFHQIKAIECYYSGDLMSEKFHIEKALHCMSSFEHYIADNPQYFIEQFHRYLLLLRRIDIAEFNKKMNEFIGFQHKSFLKNKPFLSSMLLTYAYNTKLVYLLENQAYKEAKTFYTQFVSPFIQLRQTLIPHNFYIIFLYMEIYIEIAHSNFDLAHKKLMFLNQNIQYGIRPDLFVILKILELLIHSEINNVVLVKNLSSSTQKYLKNKKQLYKSEKLLISFFNRFTKYDTAEKKATALIKLKNDFNTIMNEDKKEMRFQFYFNFISWIDAKLQNCTMAEV